RMRLNYQPGRMEGREGYPERGLESRGECNGYAKY
ncbi:hypothetical protein I352_02648, partial [Cryptococcus deuterogattii MMRL2647]